jgi:hypothetical protein
VSIWETHPMASADTTTAWRVHTAGGSRYSSVDCDRHRFEVQPNRTVVVIRFSAYRASNVQTALDTLNSGKQDNQHQVAHSGTISASAPFDNRKHNGATQRQTAIDGKQPNLTSTLDITQRLLVQRRLVLSRQPDPLPQGVLKKRATTNVRTARRLNNNKQDNQYPPAQHYRDHQRVKRGAS